MLGLLPFGSGVTAWRLTLHLCFRGVRVLPRAPALLALDWMAVPLVWAFWTALRRAWRAYLQPYISSDGILRPSPRLHCALILQRCGSSAERLLCCRCWQRARHRYESFTAAAFAGCAALPHGPLCLGCSCHPMGGAWQGCSTGRRRGVAWTFPGGSVRLRSSLLTTKHTHAAASCLLFAGERCRRKWLRGLVLLALLTPATHLRRGRAAAAAHLPSKERENFRALGAFPCSGFTFFSTSTFPCQASRSRLLCAAYRSLKDFWQMSLLANISGLPGRTRRTSTPPPASRRATLLHLPSTPFSSKPSLSTTASFTWHFFVSRRVSVQNASPSPACCFQGAAGVNSGMRRSLRA